MVFVCLFAAIALRHFALIAFGYFAVKFAFRHFTIRFISIPFQSFIFGVNPAKDQDYFQACAKYL